MFKLNIVLSTKVQLGPATRWLFLKCLLGAIYVIEKQIFMKLLEKSELKSIFLITITITLVCPV